MKVVPILSERERACWSISIRLFLHGRGAAVPWPAQPESRGFAPLAGSGQRLPVLMFGRILGGRGGASFRPGCVRRSVLATVGGMLVAGDAAR
jgi:hypothetical protein